MTCYIDPYDKVHKITRMGKTIAEDGFFGEEVLAARSEIERLADEEIWLARSLRDKLIKEARVSFDTSAAILLGNRDAQLEKIRQENDPFLAVNDASTLEDTEVITPTEAIVSNDGVTSLEAPQSSVNDIQQVVHKRLWVTADQLTRRTCPSTKCGSVGWFLDGQIVEVFEDTGSWARVTPYYDAACENGVSRFVDKGNSRCVSDNGIDDGKLAEWVFMKFLSDEKPEDPVAIDERWDRLISKSDNYRRFQLEFIAAAKTLVLGGRCTENDFKENGGWAKSSSQGNKPIYFMYCGGFTLANRIYLDANSGRIFK